MADFQTLSDVSLAESNRNDADSFDVKVGDEVRNFRLYFTDAPETNFTFLDRINEQAASFGVPASEVPRLGKKAKERTNELLKNEKFEVITRGEMAGTGSDKLGDRVMAMVRFPDKAGTDEEFLSHRLVKEGLARPHGLGANFPGATEPEIRNKLNELSPLVPTRAKGGMNIEVTPQKFVEMPQFKNAPAEKKAEYFDAYTKMIQDGVDKTFGKADLATLSKVRDQADKFLYKTLLKDPAVSKEEAAKIMASRVFPEEAFDIDKKATAYVRAHPDPRKRDLAEVILQDKTTKQSQRLELPKEELKGKHIGTVLFEHRDELNDVQGGKSFLGLVESNLLSPLGPGTPAALTNINRQAFGGFIGDGLGAAIKGLAVTLGGDEDSAAHKVGQVLDDIGENVIARGTTKNRLRQFAPTIPERLPVTLGRGAGQVAGAFATGAAVKGAGLAIKVATLGSQAFGQIVSETYTKARDLGADEDSARSAAVTAAALGAPLETLADLTLLKLVNVRAVAAVANNGGWGRTVGKILGGAAVEAATEGEQEKISNKVLKAMISEGVDTDEGITEARVVGGLLGAGVGTVGTITDRVKKMDPELRKRFLAALDNTKATKREKRQLLADSNAELNAASGLNEEQMGELLSVKAFDQLIKDSDGSATKAYDTLGYYTAAKSAGLIPADDDGTNMVAVTNAAAQKLQDELIGEESATEPPPLPAQETPPTAEEPPPLPRQQEPPPIPGSPEAVISSIADAINERDDAENVFQARREEARLRALDPQEDPPVSDAETADLLFGDENEPALQQAREDARLRALEGPDTDPIIETAKAINQQKIETIAKARTKLAADLEALNKAEQTPQAAPEGVAEEVIFNARNPSAQTPQKENLKGERNAEDEDAAPAPTPTPQKEKLAIPEIDPAFADLMGEENRPITPEEEVLIEEAYRKIVNHPAVLRRVAATFPEVVDNIVNHPLRQKFKETDEDLIEEFREVAAGKADMDSLGLPDLALDNAIKELFPKTWRTGYQSEEINAEVISRADKKIAQMIVDRLEGKSAPEAPSKATRSLDAAFEANGEFVPTSEALSIISEDPAISEDQRELASVLNEKLKASGAESSILAQPLKGPDGATSGDIISVESEREFTPTQRAHIILHEMVHAASINTLSRDQSSLSKTEKAAAAGVRDVFSKAEAALGDEARSIYGFNNDKEFVAEVLTNRQLQDRLAQIPWSGDLASTGSIWDKFITAIKKLIGAGNMSDAAIRASLRVIQVDQGLRNEAQRQEAKRRENEAEEREAAREAEATPATSPAPERKASPEDARLLKSRAVAQVIPTDGNTLASINSGDITSIKVGRKPKVSAGNIIQFKDAQGRTTKGLVNGPVTQSDKQWSIPFRLIGDPVTTPNPEAVNQIPTDLEELKGLQKRAADTIKRQANAADDRIKAESRRETNIRDTKVRSKLTDKKKQAIEVFAPLTEITKAEVQGIKNQIKTVEKAISDLRSRKPFVKAKDSGGLEIPTITRRVPSLEGEFRAVKRGLLRPGALKGEANTLAASSINDILADLPESPSLSTLKKELRNLQLDLDNILRAGETIPGRTQSNVELISNNRVNQILGNMKPYELASIPFDEFVKIVDKKILFKREDFKGTDTGVFIGVDMVSPIKPVTVGDVEGNKKAVEKVIDREVRRHALGRGETVDNPLNSVVRKEAFERWKSARAMSKSVPRREKARKMDAENGDHTAAMAEEFAIDLQAYFRKAFPEQRDTKASKFDKEVEEGDRERKQRGFEGKGQTLEADVENVRTKGEEFALEEEPHTWLSAMTEYVDRITAASKQGAVAYRATLQDFRDANILTEDEIPSITETDVYVELMGSLKVNSGSVTLSHKEALKLAGERNPKLSGTELKEVANALREQSRALPTITDHMGMQAAIRAVRKKDPLFGQAFLQAPLNPILFQELMTTGVATGVVPAPLNTGGTTRTSWMPSIAMVDQAWDKVVDAMDRLDHNEQKIYAAAWETSWKLSQRGNERKGIVREADTMEPLDDEAVMALAAQAARDKWIDNIDVGISNSADDPAWKAAFNEKLKNILSKMYRGEEVYLSESQFDAAVSANQTDFRDELDSQEDLDFEKAAGSRFPGTGFSSPNNTPKGANTSRTMSERSKGIHQLMERVRAGKISGGHLTTFIKDNTAFQPTKDLITALEKAVPQIKGVRVRTEKLAHSMAVARPIKPGVVDIILADSIGEVSSDLLHTFAEELVHSASFITNASEGLAIDLIADVRKALAKQKKFKPYINLNTEQLRAAHFSGKTPLTKTEYVNLYALTSPQETIAHAVISPGFRKLLEDSKVDLNGFVEANFGKEVAAASGEFAKGWIEATRARELQTMQASLNGREPRSAPTNPIAAMSDEQKETANKAHRIANQSAKGIDGVNSDSLKRWASNNVDKVVFGMKKGLSPEEAALYKKKGEQLAAILTSADITNKSDETLKSRYQWALLSLFDERVNPRNAWNFATEIVSNTMSVRALTKIEGEEGEIVDTNSLSQALVGTRAKARMITTTANGMEAAMDFWNDLEFGGSVMSGGGRTAHKARINAFDKREGELRKKLKLKPRDIREALMANQLFSMPSEKELMKNNEEGLTLDELEHRQLQANLASQRESIRAKKAVHMNNVRKKDEAAVDREVLEALESIAKQPNYKAAKKEAERLLGPKKDQYRRAMVDEFTALRPEFRFVTEMARGGTWQEIRDYLPTVVDNPNRRVRDKSIGEDITAEDIVDEEGIMGQLDNGTIGVGIHSASLMRKGLAPDGEHYYRSMSQATLGQAFGSQSYEVATLADRQAISKATVTGHHSKRDSGRLAPIFSTDSGNLQAKNVLEAVRAQTLKAYQHDRSGIPSGPMSDVLRFGMKAAYYHALVGLAQPTIQMAPGFVGWVGTSAGPGGGRKLSHYFKNAFEIAPWVGEKAPMVDAFIARWGPHYDTRTANADKEALTASETRLLPLWESAESIPQKATLARRKAFAKLQGGLEQYFTALSNLAIGAPEKVLLRPILITEYRFNAMKNGTTKSMNDDSIFTSEGMDLPAWRDALEMVDNIGAPSDTANRGSAFIPQGNGPAAETLKNAFLPFAGHNLSLASQGTLAYYDLFKGGDKVQGMRRIANIGGQQLTYAALIVFVVSEMQDWLQTGGVHIAELFEKMGLMAVDKDAALAKIHERQQERWDTPWGTRVLGAGYTALDDLFPMIPAVGALLATPLGTQAGGTMIDLAKEKYGGSEGFWKQLGNVSYKGTSLELEKILAIAGPGGEIIADFFMNMPELIGTLFIPERAARRGARSSLEEGLKAANDEDVFIPGL